ncbi:uncharacterized protein [Musca autumnalis]|uniref:uncharacterized protein n=1 Tax=Musca autumnalis TaxID=221902 RepID=UPI003CEB4123
MVTKELLIVLFISVLCSSYPRSVSVIGDVYIVVENGIFRCDKITCPAEAERCLVTKEKDPKDPSILVRTNICYSRTGQELSNSVNNETVDPSTQISLHVEGNRSGGISSVNSINNGNSNDFDSEEFAANMEIFRNNLNQEMYNLNRELSQMSQNLANMFG